MDLLLHDAAAAIERDATSDWRSDHALEARITGLGRHRNPDERTGETTDAQRPADR